LALVSTLQAWTRRSSSAPRPGPSGTQGGRAPSRARRGGPARAWRRPAAAPRAEPWRKSPAAALCERARPRDSRRSAVPAA